MSAENNDKPFEGSRTARLSVLESISKNFVRASKNGANAMHDGTFFRPLLRSEQITLSNTCHCRSSDWSKLRLWIPKENSLRDDFSGWLEKNVSFNTFEGLVAISVGENTTGKVQDSTIPSSGIHFNTLIKNSILDRQCRVYNNTIIKDTYIGETSCVLNNGQLTHSSQSSNYGMLTLTIGPESGGGREISVLLESTMIDICQRLKISCEGEEKNENQSALSPYNIIGRDCIFRNNPTAQNIFLYPKSKIEATNNIESAILLPHASIGHGTSVENVLLQWNASIHQSHVANVLLMEQAHVGPNSIVQDSILGPDVHVSAGEVHASLIGPNTNAHHQSLIISVLWPLGRGNVGYGANVGSNHTGRLPDQEVVAAEGIFWGLSSVIKFPLNIAAPYSIVAAGTTLTPQQISMPFSLLVEQRQECQFIPGWVLQNSPYTIARSETKFSTRRKAKRHEWYTGWKIMRPSTIDLIWTSREILKKINGSLDYKNVPGIGKAVLSEKARKVGIAAYTACIQRYALLGLLQHCLDNLEEIKEKRILEIGDHNKKMIPSMDLDKPSWPVLPWEEQRCLWDHQKTILFHEFQSLKLTDLLIKLLQLEQDYSRNVWKSKNRDDIRGVKIIPGYVDSHICADEDGVVQSAKLHSQRVEQSVQKILLTLGRNQSRL